MVTHVLSYILSVTSLLPLVSPQFPEFCAKPSAAIVGSVKILSDYTEYAEYLEATQTLTGLNETVCYKATFRDEHGRNITRLYTVQYTALTQYYPVTNSYTFSIPRLTATCFCRCTGGGSECSELTDKCPKEPSDNGTCWNIFAGGQTPGGCVWVGGQTRSCCTVTASPSSPDYTALQLASYQDRLEFVVSVLDLDNRQVIRAPEHITIEATTGLLELDDVMVLKVGFPGISQLLPSGMYYALNTTLYTAALVNGVDQWDSDQLGWMKRDHTTGGFRVLDGGLENTVFKIRTMDCGKNDIKLGFYGNYYLNPDNSISNQNQELEGQPGIPVEAYHRGKVRWAELVNVTGGGMAREVKVSADSVPRLSFTLLSTNKTTDSVWLYDTARLGGFTAHITHAPYGNVLITVVLSDVVGGLVGYVQSTSPEYSNSTLYEDVNFYISSARSEVEVTQTIGTPCSRVEAVCLKASGTAQYTCNKTKIPCILQDGNTRLFSPPSSHIAYKALATADNFRLETWKKYAGIRKTFKGRVQREELVFLALYLVLFLVCVVSCYKCYLRTRANTLPHSDELDKRILSSPSCSSSKSDELEIQRNPTFEEVGYNLEQDIPPYDPGNLPAKYSI